VKMNARLKGIFGSLKKIYDKTGLDRQIKPLLNRYRTMPEEQKKPLHLGVVFLIIALNGVFFLSPALTRFNETRTKVAKFEGDLALAREDVAKTEMIIRSKVKTDAALDEAHGRILEAHETHPFLDALSGLAKKSGIDIQGLEPIVGLPVLEAVKDLPKGYSVNGYLLTADSGFHALGKFVALLEGFETFVQIKNLEIYHEEQAGSRSHYVSMEFEMLQSEIKDAKIQ